MSEWIDGRICLLKRIVPDSEVQKPAPKANSGF